MKINPSLSEESITTDNLSFNSKLLLLIFIFKISQFSSIILELIKLYGGELASTLK
jgi:hypothetical protein